MQPSRQEPSRRRGREGGARRGRCAPWVGVFVLLGIALVLDPASAAGQSDIDGEYGLRVTDVNGEIGVGWLTSGAQSGVLRVFADGALLEDLTTPAGGAHYVSFPRPSGDVELHFGVEGAAPHVTTLFLGPEGPRESGELTGIDSLFVVGDVHGEYDRLLTLLGNADLVDEEGRWIGGGRHIAFLGDLFDRGDDVTRTLWFLYRLEREARAAGGGAHVVLGNHEVMVFTEDVRYVAPKEQLLAQLHGVSYTEMFDIRTTVLGRWLAMRPGLMRIDGALMAHGGVVPEIEPHSVAAVNDSIRAYLAEDLFYRWADASVALVNDSAMAEAVKDDYSTVIVMDSAAVARRMGLLFDERSIVWYRGYVQLDTLGAALDRVLDNFDAEFHVVGHTPVPEVGSRYDGKLLGVDLEQAASEMLLLTRDAEGVDERWRFKLTGPPERIR